MKMRDKMLMEEQEAKILLLKARLRRVAGGTPQ